MSREFWITVDLLWRDPADHSDHGTSTITMMLLCDLDSPEAVGEAVSEGVYDDAIARYLDDFPDLRDTEIVTIVLREVSDGPMPLT